MELVKVRIKADYHGHTHCGEEVFPGDEIEVTPTRAAWLFKIGAVEPVKKTVPVTDSEITPEPEENDEPEGDEEEPSTT